MKVEEPLAIYGIKKNDLDSDIELINHARSGVQTKMLWDFLKVIKTSKSDFEELLPYSLKTFSRKSTLDESMGERILTIIRVFKVGEEFFGDVAPFKDWINRYNPILGDCPKNYLKTTTGCQVIIDTLGRAAHGVMA
ncbi:MAG: DUF2384 domain-containing protein [Marinoscillum sp.]